jgi:hypothetical protein
LILGFVKLPAKVDAGTKRENTMTLPTALWTNTQFHRKAIAVVIAGMTGVCGCGGGSTTSSAPNLPAPGIPVAQDAKVTGQYNAVLTSTSGRGTTNVYTNFAQSGKNITGGANTLACPSNDLAQCIGGDAAAASITLNGTVGGANVTMTISFPSTAGADSVTMTGKATGTNLAGTYTDTLGDAGTWTASAAIYPFGPPPNVYDYSGTFNSTANPLLIAPTILIELGQDTNSNLAGKATIMNSPCISSLTLSGQAIGDALSLTDAASKARITALPTQPPGNNFTFSYKFEPTAGSCAGDLGRGTMTINSSPWSY